MVFVLRFNHPDLGSHADPAGWAGGYRSGVAAGVRPSRIVIGEVRAEECLDLLLARHQG
jgi:hypothetical protein